MAGPSKKMHATDGEVSYDLLEENEYSGISEGKINAKISLAGEQSVSDNSSMQPDLQANSCAEGPHFPFTGKPGINVDLEDPSNPLEYFELFCIPDTAKSNSQRNKSICPTIF
jgi:hypothetical protein